MELFDGDVVVLRNGRRGVVAGDIIAFTGNIVSPDYMFVDNFIYTGDYTNLDKEDYDIMSVYRIDWGDDMHEGSREYKLVWKRVDPRYMLNDGDIVTLRNGKDYIVSGPYFVHGYTIECVPLSGPYVLPKRRYDVVCWDDFTDDLQHPGSNSDVDVMVITRDGKEIWRRD